VYRHLIPCVLEKEKKKKKKKKREKKKEKKIDEARLFLHKLFINRRRYFRCYLENKYLYADPGLVTYRVYKQHDLAMS